MSTTEFKVGQKWRVVDAKEFNFGLMSHLYEDEFPVNNGNVIELVEKVPKGWVAKISDTAYKTLTDESDRDAGLLEIVENVQEDSEELPTEFAVGQLWYVDDDSEKGFACPYGSVEGDIIEITRKDLCTRILWYGYNHAQDQDDIILYNHDCNNNLKYIGTKETHGHLIGKPTETSESVSELPCSEAPEGVEVFSQGSIDSSSELLWKFIEGSSECNGHKQLEISEMNFDSLKKIVVSLGDYLGESGETIHDVLEIRLISNGDSWGASVYQACYWSTHEHHLGHLDRLLFGVEKVTGI